MQVQDQSHKQEFFPKNKEGKYVGAMNNEYQSSFLPIFQHAETQIKVLITKYLWQGKSEYQLKLVIDAYIKDVEKKIPGELPNRNAYIDGLRKKSYSMVNKEYHKAKKEFAIVAGLLATGLLSSGQKVPKIDTPEKVNSVLTKSKINFNMWEQAKAAVRVKDYPKSIKRYVDTLTGEITTTYEPGKKPISLWQKAELDVRYGHQMEMLQEAIDSGNDLFWISSHPDCSKRCEKWQGKLVSVTKPSTMSGFRVGKVDGNWVYSLPEIMAQTDKYGYHNNIINGFNCRHYLIKYESGKLPPKEYSSQDVKRLRAVNDKIRAMEREIRSAKTQERLYNEIGDTKSAREFRAKANLLTTQYKAYCEKNGFAWYQYRINI